MEPGVDGEETAVHAQGGAGDPGRVPGGEEGDGGRDVLGLADPAERIQPALPVSSASRPAQAAVRIVPGATRLTRTPRGPAWPGERTGQASQARLGGAVGVVAEVLLAVDRSDVDDRAAAGGHQVRQRGAASSGRGRSG